MKPKADTIKRDLRIESKCATWNEKINATYLTPKKETKTEREKYFEAIRNTRDRRDANTDESWSERDTEFEG